MLSVVILAVSATALEVRGARGYIEDAGHRVVESVAEADASVILLTNGTAGPRNWPASPTIAVVRDVEQRPIDVRRAIAAGVLGVLDSSALTPMMVGRALETAVEGGVTLCPMSAQVVQATLAVGRRRSGGELTARQQQVLLLLARELSNRAIAERLGIKAETVKTYVRQLCEVLGGFDRVHVVEVARERGFLE